MKKCLLLLLLAASLLLTACTALAEAEPQVEAMLTAIEENDEASTLALLHPDILTETKEEDLMRKIALWNELFDGETWEKYAYNSVSVNTDGATRTEEATCKVALTNGTKLILQYTYVSDESGEGFTAFRLTQGNG